MSDVKSQLSDDRYQTSDVQCLLSDIWFPICTMSDVKCQLSDDRCWTSYVSCQMSDFRYVWCLILYIRRLMTDYRCLLTDVTHLMCMSDVSCLMSAVRRLISNICMMSDVSHTGISGVWCQTSYVRCQTSAVKKFGCQTSDVSNMYDVWCQMSDVRCQLLDICLTSVVRY